MAYLGVFVAYSARSRGAWPLVLVRCGGGDEEPAAGNSIDGMTHIVGHNRI